MNATSTRTDGTTLTDDIGSSAGMNTCGTCKYRGKPVEGYNYDEATDKEWFDTTYFLCDLIKHINGESPTFKAGLGAGVKDGSGYYAALCVESDFGCNRWAAAHQPQSSSAQEGK